MKQRLGRFLAVLSTSFFIFGAAASAHVVVQPASVGVAETQIFTVSVPTEKDNPTIALRLVMPASLQEITPTVKAGWDISTKKDSQNNITEIDWTGGSIAPDMLDLFTFRAQAPAKTGELHWKAYQTYQDGSVVSWDATPNGSDDATGDKGPYSITRVVDDLSAAPAAAKANNWPYIISGASVAIALMALALSVSRK